MLFGEQLFWCKEWCAAMADKITDFVYADDSKETIDVINVLLLGWILLGLVVYVLGNVIAAHWRRKKGAPPPTKRTALRTPSADDGTTPEAAEGDDSPCATAPCSHDATPRSEEGEGEQEDEPLVVEGGDLCEWVSLVLGWVRRERVVSPLADAWMDGLNASTRIASTEHGLLVDFRDLLPASSPPKVRAIKEIDEAQAVECDVELRNASFELGVWRYGEGGSRLPPLPYVLHLHTLTGKLWVECSPRDVSFVARYLEPPEMELSVEPSNDIQDVDQLCDVVQGVCRDALRSSCVRLRLACFPECPRPPHLTPTVDEAEGRELLVKVVRAENLHEGVLRSFCVVEVDDPPQRHSTPPAQGSSPQFDAHLTLSVKDSAELLFEVYDQVKADSGGGGGGSGLLGLCMVEVGELLRHPRQRQVVPLASMSHDAPPSEATLTLEFVFPEVRHVETNSRVTSQGTLITTTTIQRTNQECSLVPLETMPNAKANPNPSLHAIEEMLHPETPSDSLHEKYSTLDGCDETLNMQNGTDSVELSAPSDATVEQETAPKSRFQKVDSLDTASTFSEEGTQSFDSVVKQLPDTLDQSVEQKQLVSCGEPASHELSYEPRNMQRVDLHAPNGCPITQTQDLKSDLHVEDVEIGPILFENEKMTPESCAKIDGTVHVVCNGKQKGATNGRKSVPVIKPPPAILVSETDEDAPLSVARDGECVAGRALAQLGASPSGTSRSTLIIHSVHRPECSSPEDSRSEPPSPQHKEDEVRAGRKGGVLGALRRRLSLRSSERSSNPSSPRRTLGSSTRSSLSEVSSAATFVHENSTLVIETNENGIVRRYLIPGGHMKKQPRGAKLHIFNDHVFVARHLAGSVPCCVCERHLTRRPGKQGYECRGCGVRCHKRCHVRVGDFCPNSSVNAMEVEYLQGASPKSI